jgi:hypothetical protein
LSTSGQTEFIVRANGQFSLSCESQTSFNGNQYNNLVQETRNGVTKTLTSSANTGFGFNIPLYTGYDSVKVAGAVGVLPLAPRSGKSAGLQMKVNGRTLVISGIADRQGQSMDIGLFRMDGSRVTIRAARSAGDGSYVAEGLPCGIYSAVANGERRIARRIAIP